MKKHIIIFLALVTAFRLTASAQPDQPKHKIAIFAPLYLDSAFNEEDKYRYAGNTFPKFINPGLEFYEGAQLALDSLKKEAVPLEVLDEPARRDGADARRLGRPQRRAGGAEVEV